jgi:ATP-dependent DNA ligase
VTERRGEGLALVRPGSGGLPVRPPVPPMLARLARDLPDGGDVLYEPKWDGFRCLVFRCGSDVQLRSRHDRPLERYFPELVAAFLEVPDPAYALDGEIVLVRDGAFDFPALMARLHPAATRVARLSREMPAAFVGFDVLATGGEDLRDVPFGERRARLERLLGSASDPLHVTPSTWDRALAAEWLRRFEGGGVDGVMVKDRSLRYLPGSRAMLKVKRERTADCVVAGIRSAGDPPVVASILLGLHEDDGRLEHVGVVTTLPRDLRAVLMAELLPLVVPLEGHPWEHGFLLEGGHTGRLKGSAGRWAPGMERDWIPIAPERVAEVGYDQLDGRRFRHPARFRRWRPDREPGSCTFEQLAPPVERLAGLLPAR